MIQSKVQPIHWIVRDVIGAMELASTKIDYTPQASDMDKIKLAGEISTLLVMSRNKLDQLINVYERPNDSL